MCLFRIQAPLLYCTVIMSLMASQITSLTIVYSPVCSDTEQRKHQSSASLAFVRGIHRGPVNSPHKWPVTRKMFPFDDVIIWTNRIALVPRCIYMRHLASICQPTERHRCENTYPPVTTKPAGCQPTGPSPHCWIHTTWCQEFAA